MRRSFPILIFLRPIDIPQVRSKKEIYSVFDLDRILLGKGSEDTAKPSNSQVKVETSTDSTRTKIRVCIFVFFLYNKFHYNTLQ